MGVLQLTIQVLNIAPKVTANELETFFACCGNVADIQLLRDKNESQSALVTFRQPFAFKIALLLDNAVIANQQIRVLPSKVANEDPISAKSYSSNKDEGNIFIEQNANMNHSKEKNALSQKSWKLVIQIRSVIFAAGKAIQAFAAIIIPNVYIITGLVLLWTALKRAAKYVTKRGVKRGTSIQKKE